MNFEDVDVALNLGRAHGIDDNESSEAENIEEEDIPIKRRGEGKKENITLLFKNLSPMMNLMNISNQNFLRNIRLRIIK